MVDRPLLNRDLLYLSTFFLLKNFGLPLTQSSSVIIMYKHLIPDSIVESIPACRARDPGSIPGQGVPFFPIRGFSAFLIMGVV